MAIHKIAIDLTPLLPGGENGGAKIFAIELIRQLALLAPDCQFILLTSDISHEELAILDAKNISRTIVRHSVPSYRRFESLGQRVLNLLPASVRARLSYLLITRFRRAQSKNLVKQLNAELLFCPFTAPIYHEPSLTTVSVVHDLQYRTYPQFFSTEQVYQRNQHFLDACRNAAVLVCISSYVKQVVLQEPEVQHERVFTILHRLPFRLPVPKEEEIQTLLERLALQPTGYLFYPANFWMHKNHEMLLTAFSMFLARGHAPELKLVCTGAPGTRLEFLKKASLRMGLDNKVVLPGFVTTEEFTALLMNCKAVIFPSLYEGFGLPVLEAMAFGRPVLCSNVTSLPEVTAGAAILFDPKCPKGICEAIEQIVSNPEVQQSFVAAGLRRARELGDAGLMARQYWEVFNYALANKQHEDAIYGIYPDYWSSDELTITVQQRPFHRKLILELFAPPQLPHRRVMIEANSGHQSLRKEWLNRGNILKFVIDLANSVDTIKITVKPCYQPSTVSESMDSRTLGIIIKRCFIEAQGQSTQLFPSGESA